MSSNTGGTSTMCVLEKKLHKIVPEMIDLFVTPLVSVLVTGYVTLTVIGPVFGRLENWVLAAMAVAFAVSFGLTFLLYKDKEEKAAPAEKAAEPDSRIASPLAGAVVALKDVPDATFAEGILGQGIAVQPTEGKIVAPADATVSTLFETHHAIGLTLDNGAELLVHIGLNTVELQGEGFMGADELSVSARSVLPIRSILRATNTSQNREQLLAALD